MIQQTILLATSFHASRKVDMHRASICAVFFAFLSLTCYQSDSASIPEFTLLTLETHLGTDPPILFTSYLTGNPEIFSMDKFGGIVNQIPCTNTDASDTDRPLIPDDSSPQWIRDYTRI